VIVASFASGGGETSRHARRGCGNPGPPAAERPIRPFSIIVQTAELWSSTWIQLRTFSPWLYSLGRQARWPQRSSRRASVAGPLGEDQNGTGGGRSEPPESGTGGHYSDVMIWKRRGAVDAAPTPGLVPTRAAEGASGLASADVVCLYRTLLGRLPSADEVASQRAATDDWRALLVAITSSAEYKAAWSAGGNRASTADQALVNVWHPDLSRFGHRPGTWSRDAEAVMGKEGWIFLARGSNSVLDQYQSDFALPTGWADRWADVVRVRREEATGSGAALALLVVPDKLSVLSAHLPDEIALASRPPAAALSDDLGLGVIYPVAQLARVPGGAYLRADTHLSLAGNSALAGVVLAALSGPDQPVVGSDVRTVQYARLGDLGSRFDPPVLEVVATYGSLGGAVVVADNHDDVEAAGRHVGTRRVLRNATAPDSRTAVVFGDSYSFPEPRYQGIAWFLAQYFREVHFVWSPFGWDKDYVEASGAEVVLCETAERFVPRPPALRLTVADLVRSAVAFL